MVLKLFEFKCLLLKVSLYNKLNWECSMSKVPLSRAFLLVLEKKLEAQRLFDIKDES